MSENKRLKKNKAAFIRKVSKMSGLEEVECLRLLKDKYERYNPEETPRYIRYLMGISNDRFEQKIKDRQDKKRAAVPIEFCPYHTDETVIPDARQLARFTRIPSWTCPEGGNRCYIRWKLDELFKTIGKTPIDWNEFDEQKEKLLEENIHNA